MDLLHGDCLELMKDIPDRSIDMILCDLPYGTTACKWDTVIPFEKLWNHYRRITKENAAIVLFAAQPFTTALIHSNRTMYRYNWYWIKNTVTGAPFAKVQPMRKLEDICVFYKKAPTYNPLGLRKLETPIIRRKKGQRDAIYKCNQKSSISIQNFTNYPTNLLYFNTDVRRMHSTQKPIPLLEYLIKTYTHEGETVLDNCMGSGSTGVACVNTGRRFIGIEQDPEYYETAKSRIEKIFDN